MTTFQKGPISQFIRYHFCHFNARELLRAAENYELFLKKSGKMFLTLAGAMSTAQLGRSLAEMIRQNRVHAICCTGANLEEDLFRLIANESYVDVECYRDLKPEEEKKLLEKKLCRVTDTCIPEDDAMRTIENAILPLWQAAEQKKQKFFPHEYFYQLLQSKVLEKHYQMDPKESWLLAASEKNLPLFVPGWEDSTLGNTFVSKNLLGKLQSLSAMRSGLEIMKELSKWYEQTSQKNPIGFFQIGGGIAGDFPICVVPLLNIDLKKEVPLWEYFCQISDSTTSYGSYSGAVPNEKITWGKLDIKTPKFIIESDATIVAPLIFAYVLNW